jgi:cell division protein FtsI/penicillin-binding protein 2
VSRCRLAAAVVLVLGTLAACGGHGHSSAQRAAGQRFLDALGRGDTTAAAAETSDPEAAQAGIAASLAGLGAGAKGTLRARSLSHDTVRFDAAWTLPGASAPWRYQGQLQLVQHGGSWVVLWSATDIAPGLAAGQHLLARRVQPSRAALEDASGRALFTRTAVVDVGIQPSLVKNLRSLAATLASSLHISASDIVTSVKAAPSPQAFVDVITLRKPAYDAVRAIIHPLPGTVFRTGTELLAPSSRFAQPLLGHVGPATAEIVKASGGRAQAGEQTGLDGLQQVFDKQLAGTDGVDVYAADPNGVAATKLGSAGAATPGTPVRLTLDRSVQTAADAALRDLPQQAAIVALQPSTGRILAVANSASTPGDIALAGQYPPGSAYKIVTATAALAAGRLSADTREACPGTKTVDGRVFVNEDRFDLGTVSLRTAFAMSCNTTFMTLGLALPPTALPAAARQLGLGAPWQLPVESFSGSVPPPAGQTEKAADAIGQGRVLVSPLAMAEAAGAAQSGRPVAPSLVVGHQARPGTALPATITATLHDLMRATVTSGRGAALEDLPGEVAGKTGTAEYGTAVPPRSHGWFAGYRGDLSFAVFVYDGQTSQVAVGVTHAFLDGLR